MDSLQSKALIELLAEKWGISSSLDLDNLIGELDNSVLPPFSISNTYEFSLNASEKTIRPLHLNFYRPGLPSEIINKLRLRRVNAIRRIVKWANHLSPKRWNYNIDIINYLYRLTEKTPWPIQFGCSIDQNDAPVIKVYLSITDNTTSRLSCEEKLRKLCGFLELEWENLEDVFRNDRYDAVGIDLTPDGRGALKIYTYYVPPFDYTRIKQTFQKYQRDKNVLVDSYLSWIKQMSLRHIGFLYRISADSRVGAIKIWARLEQATPHAHLPVLSLSNRELSDWWEGVPLILNKATSKMSYVILEEQSLGVYFR